MQASGVILSGGESSRMTFNKAFADIGGRSVLETIIYKFEKYFKELIIITNEPEMYYGMGPDVYTDVYPHMGPIAGIHSALYHAHYEPVFLMGCDMPFINMELVEFMLKSSQGYDSVVPVINSYLQPLAAVYNYSCLPVLTECLEHNKLKLTRIFEDLNTRYIHEKELQKYGDIDKIFFNVNDMEALIKARNMARRLVE